MQTGVRLANTKEQADNYISSLPKLAIRARAGEPGLILRSIVPIIWH